MQAPAATQADIDQVLHELRHLPVPVAERRLEAYQQVFEGRVEAILPVHTPKLFDIGQLGQIMQHFYFPPAGT